MRSPIIAAALLLTLLVQPTRAAVVSLDFDVQNNVSPNQITPTMSGEEVAGVGLIFTGQTGPWNSLIVGNDNITDANVTYQPLTAPLVTSPLLAGDGTLTNMTFTFGVGASAGSPISNYGAVDATGSGASDLRRDMIILGSAAAVNWEIAGLLPGQSYDLVLFGQQYNNLAFNPAAFTVFGGGPSPGGLLDAQNDGNFPSIVANANGKILGTMDFTGTNVSSWSGLQIQGQFVPVVPEPSTFALLGLGAIGLAIRTRRRRTAA